MVLEGNNGGRLRCHRVQSDHLRQHARDRYHDRRRIHGLPDLRNDVVAGHIKEAMAHIDRTVPTLHPEVLAMLA